MRETGILLQHFFRRFFDNDTLQADGDTTTSVVRGIALTAVPGLIVAFFLQTAYASVAGRPMWAAIGDQYFFVLFSFVVLGAGAVFEWEMLFPDRLDFLILTPLSVAPWRMLAAKAGALAGFLGLFLVSANVLGTVMLPAVSKGAYFRHLFAHAVAVGLAGVFAALLFVAVGGVMLCVLTPRLVRLVSPVVQMVAVMGLVLLMIESVRFGDELKAVLTGPLGAARWVPPFWFLGVYERLLLGERAPGFAWELAPYAYRATAAVIGVVAVTYPLAWARMRRMAIEGAAGRGRPARRMLGALVDGVIRRPAERAVFYFVGQTMARNNRYQVYLAMYGGTGLALAVACGMTLEVSAGRVVAGLSGAGLHAVLPLLLFWVVAGLRTAFAFPLNLGARWVFRVSGADLNECAAAARKWVLVFALGVAGVIVCGLAAAGWDRRRLLVQVVFGGCLAMLLTDGFFALLKSVPFNSPRMPGRRSFPLMLTLYIGVLPLFLTGVVGMEREAELHVARLLLLGCGTGLIHAGLGLLNGRPAEVEEEMEGYEGEFQLLGLS